LEAAHVQPQLQQQVHILLFRYGLPVNFQAMLLAPQKKSQKRLREVLNHLYGHLDNSAAGPAGTDVSFYCLYVVDIFFLLLNFCQE